jgi:hypothetical protein
MLRNIIERNVRWSIKCHSRENYPRNIRMLYVLDRKITGECVSAEENNMLGEYLCRINRTGFEDENRVGTFKEGNSITGRVKRYLLSHLEEGTVTNEELLAIAYPGDRPKTAKVCLRETINNISLGVDDIDIDVQLIRGKGYRVCLNKKINL